MMRFTTGDILIRKAHRGKLQEVVYLVQDIFVDVNYRNQSGQTALHYAAFYGHLEVVLALVEHGIPLNLKDKNGKNAMHWAAGSGHVSTLRILAESFDLWTDAWEKGNAEYALPDDDVGAFKPRDQQRSSPNGPLSQNRGIVITTTSGLRHAQRHMYIDIMSVRNWLKQLELGEYTESFEKDGFDTLRGVATIDEGDLIEMNVKKGHRRGILQHIEDLKNQLAAFDDQAQLSGVEPDALPTLSMLPQLVKTPSATQLQALMNQSASINIPPPSVSSGSMDYTNSN
ncbi:hypothetical protein DYB28_004557 [Aphanomyces astaci]|uniref:SAM domain-containing protein n=1 Tax=Aphanomyces astaci TaxID=112090 RepID=A0A9X8HC99_APHAT|nr:hypothetical protein DYB28_004557 [Aphanomyces astaci]